MPDEDKDKEKKDSGILEKATEMGAKSIDTLRETASEATDKVVDSARIIGEIATEKATEAAATTEKVVKGTIDKIVITVATKIVISSMKKVGNKGKSYVSNNENYQGFVDKTWELLPLPVRLIGKDSLGYNSTMHLLRNTIFGSDDEELVVDENDENTITQNVISMFK
tara:strand:+ start:54 stop:557 length:504 start_codon:yes stop_codon:yes gene_type:complete